MAKSLKVTALAGDLAQMRAMIAEVKAKHLAPLEEAEEALEQQLLTELKATGMDTLRYEGYNFIRAKKTSFKVSDAEKALLWAKDYPAVLKVDTAKAATLLQRALELPEGFERTDTEYLSVRKATTNEHE